MLEIIAATPQYLYAQTAYHHTFTKVFNTSRCKKFDAQSIQLIINN
tara:strand:+ start:265 stop:402 length:138 start_codon:yes stop_codon:yes gene_type:complete